jgi:hypothetical protein
VWSFRIIECCDDLAPHIDPTPVWKLYRAIEKFHARYHGEPPPNCQPLPSLRTMYDLMDDAQLVVERLRHAGVTNKEPVTEGDAQRLLIDALTPTQDAIYRALTDEYQSAVDIAVAANCDPDNCRRELANLKRLFLADHKPRVGYRRSNARAL